jgi:hypothetical protein
MSAPDSAFRQAQEARRDALQQHLADQRRDLARRASLSGATDPDASLRAAQADATARADAPLGSTGTAIGRVLPAVARASAGMAVANPKIWEADAKPLRGRKIDAEAYLARVRLAAKTRETGDVLEPILVRTAELVLWAVRKGGIGFARQTFEQLGKLIGCCSETARKAIRFLERHGVLDTFNVLSRDHGFVRRGANLYLIPDAEPDAERPAGNSLVERLNRYAEFFGLRARAWGLNATPAPVGYRTPPEHPAPA